jgi:hypothetical protein
MEDERARIHQLSEQDPASLTKPELLELLRLRHSAEAIPACRVCGGPLSVVSQDTSPTIWACSGQEDDPDRAGDLRHQPGRGNADQHYLNSEWRQYRHQDPWVLELVRRYEK